MTTEFDKKINERIRKMNAEEELIAKGLIKRPKKKERPYEYSYKKKGDGSRAIRDITGIKSRSPRQINRAGFTLIGGYIALPFIKIKNARHYQFKGPKRR